MANLYRVRWREDIVRESWYESLQHAESDADDLKKDGMGCVSVNTVEVPSDDAGLAAFLNRLIETTTYRARTGER